MIKVTNASVRNTFSTVTINDYPDDQTQGTIYELNVFRDEALTDSVWDKSVIGNQVTINGGLASGDSYYITYKTRTVQDYTDSNNLQNTMTAAYTDAYPEDTHVVTGDDYEEIPKFEHDLAVTKTANKTEVEPGGNITYTIGVENKSDKAETDVRIVDKLDDINLDGASAITRTQYSDGTALSKGDDYTDNGASTGFDFTIHEIAPGQKVEVMVTVPVNSTIAFSRENVTVATINNTVDVSNDYYDGVQSPITPWDTEAQVDVKVDSETANHMTLSKKITNFDVDADEGFVPGETIDYQVVLMNDGVLAQQDVTLTDVIEGTDISKDISNLKVMSSISGEVTDYDLTGNTMTFDEVAAGEILIITYQVQADDEFTELGEEYEVVTNTVTADTAENNDGDSISTTIDGNGATTSINKDLFRAAELTYTKTVTDKNDEVAQAGETLYYTINIENTGGVRQSGLTVFDQIDTDLLNTDSIANLTFSVDGDSDFSDGSVVLMGTMIYFSATGGTLNVGDSITITYAIDVKDTIELDPSETELEIVNTVSGTSSFDDSGIFDEKTRATIPVGLANDMNPAVTKSLVSTEDGNDLAKQNEELYYQVVVDNSAFNVNIPNLKVSDSVYLADENIVGNLSEVKVVNKDNEALTAGTDYTVSGNDITITNAAPGEVYTITYTMKTVNEFTDSDDIINAATLNSENFFTYGDNNDDYNSVYNTPKDLESINNLTVNKTVADTSADTKEMAEAGEQLDYQVTITNDSAIDQNNVQFVDKLSDSDFDLSTVSITSITNSRDGAITSTDSDFSDGIQLDLGTIEVGETVTIKFSVNVKEDNLGRRLVRFINSYVTNTATITSDYYTDGIDADANIELDKSAEGMADFTVEKEVLRTSDADMLADPGELITYKITVENTGSLDQTNFTLKDTPDSDEVDGNIEVTNVQIDGKDSKAYTTSANTMTINNIPSGSTAVVTYAVMTTASFVDTTDLTNTVAFYGDNVPSDMEGTKAANLVKDIKAASDLTVSKTVADADSNGLAEAGESLSYQIAIKNTGRTNLTNVAVLDSLDDPNFDLTTLTDPVATSDVNGNVAITNGDGIDLTIPSIAVGETVTITFSVDVKETNLSADMNKAITNDVVVTNGFESTDSKYEEYKDDASVNINYDDESMIDFDVTKVVTGDENDNELADVDEDISYEVTVENTGKTDFSNIQIIDSFDTEELNGGINVTSITVDGTAITSDVDYTINAALNGITLNSLPAGSKLVIDYYITTADTFVDSAPIINNIKATPQGVTGKVSMAVIEKNLGDLNSVEFTKETTEANNNKASAGETLDYTITFTNNGDIVQDNVVIEDDIEDPNLVPSSLANISVVSSEHGTLGIANEAASGLLLTIGDVVPGETITITFTVDVKDTGINSGFLRFIPSYIENIAYATTDNMDSLDIDNIQADSKIQIDTDDPEMSNLQINKELTATSVGDDLLADANDTLSYTITLDNSASKMDMNNVVVTDLIDENIDEDGITNIKVVDKEGNDVAFTPEFISIVFDTIPAGEVYTITYDTTTVSVFDEHEPVINTLTVSSDDMPKDYEQTVSVDKKEPAREDITIAKTVEDASGNDKAHYGELLTYTVTVSNNSAYNEYDVTLTDKIDDINLNRATATMISAESNIKGDIIGDLIALGTEQLMLEEVQAGEVLTFKYSVNVKTNAIARVTKDYIENQVVYGNEFYNGFEQLFKRATDEIEIDKEHDGMSELIVSKELISTSDEDMLVDPNETLTYRVKLDNSNSAMHQDNVVIVDTPDSDDMASTIANVKLTDGTNEVEGMTVSGNRVEIDQIPAGDTYYLEYTIDTNESFADTTKATNGLKVTGDDIPTSEEWDFVISNDKDIKNNTEYTFEKSAHGVDGVDDSLVTAGEEVTYTITLENTGNIGIDNIELTDTLADLNLDNTTISNVTVNDEDATFTSDGKVVVNLDNLPPGEKLEITFNVNVVTSNISRLAASYITNTVNLTSTNGDDEATSQIELDKKAEGMSELNITKSLKSSNKGESSLADPSEDLTYQLVLENSGAIDQNNVVITDTPDNADTLGEIKNVTVINSSDETLTLDEDYTVSGNVITIGQIASGETYTVTYDVTTKSEFTEVTDITNAVTVTGDDVYDRENDDDTLETSFDVAKDVASNSSVDVSKTSVDSISNDAKVIAGEEVEYTIVVNNNGNMPLYDLVVEDALADPNFDLTTATIDSITSNVSGDITNTDTDLTNGFNMTFDEVAVDETITIKLSVNIKTTNLSRLTTDYVENTASASSDLNKVTDESIDKLQIDKEADGMSEMTIDKSLVSIASGGDSVIADDTITYQIVLNNTLSKMDMNNVLVVDNVDSADTTGELTLISIKDQDGTDITGYSVDGTNMTIDNIPAGDTFTITYSVKTASTFADDSDVDNTVHVSGDDIVTNLTDEVSVPKDLEAINGMVVDKYGHGEGGEDDTLIQAGETVYYTLEVTNTGSIDQTDLRIYDAIIDSNLDFGTLTNVVFTHADGSQEDGEIHRADGALYELDVLHPGETVYLTFEINALETGISTEDSLKIENRGIASSDYFNGYDRLYAQDRFETDIDIDADNMNAIKPTKSVVSDASSNGSAATNEVISYQIVLDNTEGKMDLTDVRVVDSVDSNVIARDSFNNLKIVVTDSRGRETELSSSDYSTGSNAVTISEVPSESTVTITYDITTANRFTDDTDITNKVTLTAGNTNGEKYSEATIAKDVEAVSKLTVEKEVEDATSDSRDAAEAGERLDYTITVTNSGSMLATNINIVDAIDDINLDPTSVDNLQVKVNGSNVAYTGQLDSDGLNIVGEKLAVGQSAVITFSVNVKSSNLSTLLRNSIDNTVTVSSDYTDSTSADAAISIDKDAEGD